MNLVYKSLKFLKSLSIILIISFFLSLIIDFFFGKYILKSLDSYLQKTEFYERLLRTDHPVYHHTFLPNAEYKLTRGFEKNSNYTICTNNFGFRSKCKENSNKNFDYGFMGDSFVEGYSVNYEDSFVGIFSKNKNVSVANLGVTSYSPKIYFSKLNYLIKNGFTFKHIIFFIDISDLYDDDVFYKINKDHVVEEKYYKRKDLKRKNILRKNFPVTNYYMYVIRKNKNLNNNIDRINQEIPNWHYKAKWKGEWTYHENDRHPQYINEIPLAQKNILDMMEKVYELLKKNNIKISLAVYPWPQQLENDTVNSKHVLMWKNFCIDKCEKFINYFPFFFDEMKNADFIKTYKKYYWWNDVHFNKLGNKIIAEKLLEIF